MPQLSNLFKSLTSSTMAVLPVYAGCCGQQPPADQPLPALATSPPTPPRLA